MKFLKKSKKLIIGIIIGLIVGSVVSVYAAYSYFAEDVSYASSNGTEISVQEALDQLYARQNSLSTPIYADFTGCYADVNDDGTVDGVIFIDLAKGASGQWTNSDGSYAFLAAGNLRNYKISTKTSSYSGKFGTKQVIAPNGTSGNARFYVMTLSDYGNYNWNDSCSKTQTVGSVTFRLPSKEEWSAFAVQLGITKSNYSSIYGLSRWYHSSTEGDSSNAWGAFFEGGYMYCREKIYDHPVRLCATF